VTYPGGKTRVESNKCKLKKKKGDAVTVHATDTWEKWTFRSIHS